MTKEHEELFEEKLKVELEKARLQGIGIGAKSVSGVIYDKIKNVSRGNTKNDLLRVVKDIKKFCETGLAIKEDEVG